MPSVTTQSLKDRKEAIELATIDIEQLLLTRYWADTKPNAFARARCKKAARACAKIMFEANSHNPLQYLYHNKS